MNKKKLSLNLCLLICALLVLADFVLHKHPHYEWEKIPAFYPLVGFVISLVFVLVAKYILKPIVQRKENYYD